MKVSDILHFKGNSLYVAQADDALADAVAVMAEKTWAHWWSWSTVMS